MTERESAATYHIAATKQQPSVPIGAGIPSDWKVVFAAEVCTKIQDGTHFSPRINGGPYLYVTSKNIKRGHLDLSTAETIDAVQHSAIYRRCDVKKGDLLLTKDGANTGNAALNSLDEEFSLLSSVAFLRFSQQHFAAYFLQQILSTRGQRQIEEAMTGNAITRLTLQKINQLRFLTPPTLVEQQAIAEALSDADALIESLSLLRTKKRQIKRGVMQELLTGKKRLPGFPTPWKRSPLGRLLSVRHGRSQKLVECESGEYPILASGGRIGWAGQFLHDKPSVLIGRKGTIDKPQYMETPFWSVDTLFYTEVHHPNVAKFLFYRFCLIDWMRYNEASGVPSLSAKVIESIEIDHPEKDEQQAIADVLSDIDTEIDDVEAGLEKVQRIKQGMMQELLTGRIRLLQVSSNVIPLPIKLAAAKPPSSQSAHNWQINEAVVIGVLAQRFGNEKFPLPRKRRVKLMYLLHRNAEGRAEGYLKKAAGPYDPNTKYKGPEAIALKNGYVQALRNDKYEGFVAGDKIEQAQRYFEQWYGTAALEWLEQFHYRKTDDLELLATVDMAMVDIAASREPVDVAGIKSVIAAHPEWVPKLSRALFSDEHIARAITECQALFNG